MSIVSLGGYGVVNGEELLVIYKLCNMKFIELVVWLFVNGDLFDEYDDMVESMMCKVFVENLYRVVVVYLVVGSKTGLCVSLLVVVEKFKLEFGDCIIFVFDVC